MKLSPSFGKRRCLVVAHVALCVSATTQAYAEENDVERHAASIPEVSGETHPEANYWLPALEIAVLYGGGATWYVIDDRNVLDWDYPSVEQRITGEAWRFDSNGFGMNFFGHPLAGMGSYMFARGNRLGVWPSWGYSVAGSTFWELGVEFNEKISINDMLVTPGAALPFGEFFHKLAGYVSSAPSSAVGRSLAWSLGLTVHGHRQLEGRAAPAFTPDNLGLSSDYWHDFKVGLASGRTQRGTREAMTNLFRVSGRLVTLPQYHAHQDSETWFYRGEFSAMHAEIDQTGSYLGVDLHAETLLAGYHMARRLSATRGSSALLTVATLVAYEYRDSRAAGFNDLSGLLHAPGLALDALVQHAPLSSSFSLRASPSFGAVSTTLPAPVQPEEGRDKATLQRYGYYYVVGPTISANAGVRVAALSVDGAAKFGCYPSIEGLDRAQEELVRDTELRECSREYGVSARFAPPGVPWSLALQHGVRSRFSLRERHRDTPGATGSVRGARTLIEAQVRF